MPAGRPRKFNTVEELRNKINEYFDWCDSEKREIITEKGITIILKPYTVSGLCLYLDICRDTLLEWEKNVEEFSDTIKKAKIRIENFIEEKSITGYLNPTVSIFNLKNNFGWKDKQEVEQSGGLNINISGQVEEWSK
jgi:hypothetical protein